MDCRIEYHGSDKRTSVRKLAGREAKKAFDVKQKSWDCPKAQSVSKAAHEERYQKTEPRVAYQLKTLKQGTRFSKISEGVDVAGRSVPIIRNEFERMCEMKKDLSWRNVESGIVWKRRLLRCSTAKTKATMK